MKKKEKIIGSLIIFAVLIIFLTIGYFNTTKRDLTQKDMEDMFVEVNKSDAKQTSVDKSDKKEVSNTNNKKVIVEIKGEVKKPDVYYLDEGSIVKDLIQQAGGLSEKADITAVNQAKKLVNNECIIINNKDQVNSNIVNKDINKEVSVSAAVSESDSIININTASKDDLDKIPGIGAVTAEKIIEYREKNNGFKSIEDIKKVDRIGDKMFEKIKDKISIN
ncbi:ComEA family DNA-binding protein [Clostridium sp. YIM B02505]|uniref:ComEA family DNA-binding protein n=1 Tax=Clostridium yunnanense TaxID=2800325 RepID=A0ABS1EPR1_9CLOT|nr:ComEA family DNA-binding protein [Clostridium yunnanense]MBK1811330.1 ComEA family DNA-binding protein [Clostridium yunnanense]